MKIEIFCKILEMYFFYNFNIEVLNKSGLFETDATVTVSVIVSPYVCLNWEMRTAP